MPNHVYNWVALGELSAPQQEKLNAIINTHNGLCGYYRPMPEEIRNTTSPTRIVSEAEYKKIMKENEKIDKTQPYYYEPKPITEKMQKALMDKYDCDNWYDWALKHWGTKWGCYDTELDGDTLRFTTAWSVLDLDIVQQFAQDFPSFELHFEEEQGWGGTIEFVDGEFVSMEEFDIPKWSDIDIVEEGQITELKEGWQASTFREGADAGYYWDYDLNCPLTDEEIKKYINDK